MAAASESPPFCCASAAGNKRDGRRAARDALVFAAGVAAAVLALLGPASPVLAPGGPAALLLVASPAPGPADGPRTFYDDPDLSYEAVGAGSRVTGWDAKRAAWLRSRGLGTGGDRHRHRERMVMVSGSQPEPCPGEAGDHLMLRFLKNKLDYCRLHGIELVYNRDVLHPAMTWAWAKIPIVRAAMLAHPEAEWVWWVDSDAVLTDMDFSLPLATRYRRHNLVVHGEPKRFFEEKSWLGLNAGVFLIRNCQWSLDLMDEWARMGPAYPEHAAWGKAIGAALSDKSDERACDQSALVYLLLTSWGRLGKKTFVETDYYFQGYWADIVDRLDAVAARYEAVEREGPAGLRRRHAEREHLRNAAARNAAVGAAVPGPAGGALSGWRRPFITHFVGCAPCSGQRNPTYAKGSCGDGIRRALGFADDQVLRAYGFRHATPLNDSVRPLPFDFPGATVRSR